MNQKLHSKEKFSKLLEKYLQGRCTPEEEKWVLEWYEATGRDQSVQWKEEEIEEIEARAHKNLRTEIQKTYKRNNSGKQIFLDSFNWRKASIAASFILFVISIAVTYQFFAEGENNELSNNEIQINAASTFTNTTTSVQKLKLEDGSIITLQPNSSIAYAKPFAPDKREISLTGEGFFEIKRDESRPFLVYTGKVVTKVLGTSFTVRSNNKSKDIIVAVKSGKVSVSRQSESFFGFKKTLKDEIILTPNEQAIYNEEENSMKASLVDVPEVVASHQALKVMRFDNAPLVEIFKALSKAYQVEIVYDAKKISECTLTTTLNNENLFERLNIICKAIGGSYAMEGTKIIFNNTRCK